MNPIIFILIGVMLGSVGQILLKIGMGRIGHFHLAIGNFWPVVFQIATSLPIWGGIFCYGASLILWLIVLSRVEVSWAYPLVSIGYVVTALAAYFVLGEHLSPMRIAGIAVIMIGVFMISKTA